MFVFFVKYSACYPEEILGLVLLDYAMRNTDFEKKSSIANCWREELDDYLEAEKKFEDKKKTRVTKELTYEHALKR